MGRKAGEDKAARDYFSSQDKSFVENVTKQLDGDKSKYGFLGWSGGNTDADRRRNIPEMADKIQAFLKDHPEDKVNLVGHSHGGNVGKLLSDELAGRGIDVDNLVLLSTPVRSEYARKQNNVRSEIAIFSKFDHVKDGMADFDRADPRNLLNPRNLLAASGLYYDFLPTIDPQARNYTIGVLPYQNPPWLPLPINELTKKNVDVMQHLDTLVSENVRGGLGGH